MRRRDLVTTALLLGLASACARSMAPPGWDAASVDSQREAFGGWVGVVHSDSAGAVFHSGGELAAVSRDSLWLLTPTLVGIPIARIQDARLVRYDPEWDKAAWWTLFGALSTISHGFVLILTAPVWILAGSLSTSSVSRAPMVNAVDIEQMRPYARFPQGIPPNVDRTTLVRKPVVR